MAWLPNVPTGGGRRAYQRCGGRIHGEQHQAGRRSEQCARVLPADRRGRRARQEPSDIAEAPDVARQQALDEQQPSAEADQRGNLVRMTAPTPTPIAAQRAAAAAAPAMRSA
jgi:hypothetical protein